MFDFVLQFSSNALFRIFDEMRRAALPVLPQTLENLAPVDLGGGSTAEIIVNVPDRIFPLSLNEDRQSVEIVLSDIACQTRLRIPAFPGDILFDSVVSYLVNLPISVHATQDHLIIGSDPGDFDAATVLAVIETGHPLADDSVLLDLISRQFQALITAGGFPLTWDIRDQPLAGQPLEVSAFVRLVNDVGAPGGIAASVELSPQPNHVVFVVPLEIWANLELTGTDTVLRHVQALANLRVTVPVSRDLNPQDALASVTIRLTAGEAALDIVEIVEGEDVSADPMVWSEVQEFVRDTVRDALRDFGDQVFTTLSLDQLTGFARDMLRRSLTRDGAVLPFMMLERSQEFDSAQVHIRDDVLTIGVNPHQNADIRDIAPLIPPDRDFAARLDGQTVLDELAIQLRAPAQYDEIAGALSLQALSPAGTASILVGGFDNETGTLRQRTRLRIGGFLYQVQSDAQIARLDDDDAQPAEGRDRNQAVLSIAPPLRSDLTLGEAVLFEPGIGLPITEDAGGNDRSFRINDDLTPTLGDGHLRLSGTGRLRRPHAVIRNIDADVAVRLALDWAADTQMRGGGQSGDQVDVRTLSATLRRYPAGSQIFVDDDRRPFGVTADADAGDTTLSLSRDLDHNPADRGMVTSRWLQIGRVEGDAQAGNTLRIANMTEGARLIPSGTTFRVGGETFQIREDAEIDDDGNAVLILTERLDSALDDAPQDGAAIRIWGGWWGRGIMDGGDQNDHTVAVAGLVRYLPGGTRLSIAGVNGVFRTRDEVSIVDDAATVAVDHLALDEVQALLDSVGDDQLWNLLGQPAEGASVRRRSGGQSMVLRRVGDAEVTLDTPIDGILGFLIGLLAGLVAPGGFAFRALIGAIVGALVRNGLRRRLQDEANDFSLDGFGDLPVADALDGVGVYLELLFNNPIEISPDGFLLAGQVAPGSVYPEIAESRARTNGPYDLRAGVGGQLLGSGPAPSTNFTWRTGDGTVVAAVAVQHIYPRRGHFVAEYASLDAQLILERASREWTQVRVANSRPEMAPLPIIQGLEGDEVTLTGSFTDIAWLDAHRVLVDWGDGRLPEFAEVKETLGPPMTRGSFVARHRYCDNGEFTVTVILEDAQGGMARHQTMARIENVPPQVDAGPDMFAHPCVPLRLVGRFTDPGWCDTHTATWDFGDCSPLFPATVDQTHAAPMGRGTATATHCYQGCGTWQATLTVTDDDGGTGSDSIIVRKSMLMNGDFEGGFSRVALGNLGRFWHAYGIALSPSIPTEDVFGCEHCTVCDGRVAQRLRAPGFRVAGMFQTIGTNVGWEYQFAAMLHVAGRDTTGWIGIDPRGGIDRDAPEIVWRSLNAGDGWQGVSTRAVARAGAVTVFIEFRDPDVGDQLVDCVRMQAYPCVDILPERPECPPDPERQPRTICADLARFGRTGNLGSAFAFAGFLFVSGSGEALQVVTFGAPPGTRKLLIPDRDRPGSVLVDLPQPARAVIATVSGPPAQAISLRAMGSGGAILATDQSVDGGLRDLRVEAGDIRRIELTSERRGTLVRLCIETGGGHSGAGGDLAIP